MAKVTAHKHHEVYSERTNISKETFNLLVCLTLRRRNQADKTNFVDLWKTDQSILDRACSANKMLSNVSNQSLSMQAPSMVLFDTDSDWQEAYDRWLAGANPTDDPKWRQGVYLCWLK